MDSPPRKCFCDLFRAASASERRRFVADLWAARGWETHVEGAVVIARRDDRTERITVLAPGRFRLRPSIPDGATAVIALNSISRIRRVSAPDTRIIALDDLYEIVRYGFPGSAGDNLVHSHFGVRLGGPEATVCSTGQSDPLSSLLQLIPDVLILLVGFFALAVIVAAIVGIPGIVPQLGGASATDQQTPVPTSTSEPTTTPEPSIVAPGVTTAGVENATLLAAAHQETVANESYRWTLGYRESIAGDETGRKVETVRVEAPHVYVSEIRRVGKLRAFPRPIASEESYADGTTRFSRRPAESDVVAARILDPDVLDGPGRQASRAGRYIEWYLSAETSSVENVVVEDGTVLYRVRGRGNDFPRSRDYEVTAVVEESGFVPLMRVSYETRDGLGITVWFEYDAVGETTVRRPPWVDRDG